MNTRWSIRGLGVCSMACLCACAATSAHDHANVGKPAKRGPALAAPGETPSPVANDVEQAPARARSNELAAPAIDDRFGVAGQVAALERSIELYQAFIVRAGDEPQFAEAVRRSQGRIEDARLTICFLLEKPCDGSAGK